MEILGKIGMQQGGVRSSEPVQMIMSTVWECNLSGVHPLSTFIGARFQSIVR